MLFPRGLRQWEKVYEITPNANDKKRYARLYISVILTPPLYNKCIGVSVWNTTKGPTVRVCQKSASPFRVLESFESISKINLCRKPRQNFLFCVMRTAHTAFNKRLQIKFERHRSKSYEALCTQIGPLGIFSYRSFARYIGDIRNTRVCQRRTQLKGFRCKIFMPKYNEKEIIVLCSVLKSAPYDATLTFLVVPMILSTSEDNIWSYLYAARLSHLMVPADLSSIQDHLPIKYTLARFHWEKVWLTNDVCPFTSWL